MGREVKLSDQLIRADQVILDDFFLGHHVTMETNDLREYFKWEASHIFLLIFRLYLKF